MVRLVKGDGLSCLLDVKLLGFQADALRLCSEGVEHYSRIDNVLLHTLQPRIQLLEPHQLGGIWDGQGMAKQIKDKLQASTQFFRVCERVRLGGSGLLLTADLELAVLSRTEHGVGQAEPGQLLAELRQQVVCEEAHHPGHHVQDVT